MGSDSEAGEFARALSTLKRTGSGLLVVGETCDGTHLALSRRLLGQDAETTRRRVVVLIDGPTAAERRIPSTAPDDAFRVIDHRPRTRSVAAEGTPAPPTDLDRLEREIGDAIVDVSPSSSFAPAELRVCIDSLRPLVADAGVTDVTTFLEDVLFEVRDRNGMVHAHLPVAYDAPLVEVFAPSFDAVVQLRPGEQRWHLTDAERSTQWLPV